MTPKTIKTILIINDIGQKSRNKIVNSNQKLKPINTTWHFDSLNLSKLIKPTFRSKYA